ncbi:MAG: hypothetical protein NW205_10435 [Hyphomicrobiaceae bacterium]|nr:hypothetical protein [Hyphomicrobiaceae bacterium]
MTILAELERLTKTMSLATIVVLLTHIQTRLSTDVSTLEAADRLTEVVALIDAIGLQGPGPVN